ncbi:1948_t:CDS:2, partial [Funneliformis caledonium]
DGTGNDNNQKLETRLTCFLDGAATVENSSQSHIFSDRKASYDLTVSQTNTMVTCVSAMKLDTHDP